MPRARRDPLRSPLSLYMSLSLSLSLPLSLSLSLSLPLSLVLSLVLSVSSSGSWSGLCSGSGCDLRLDVVCVGTQVPPGRRRFSSRADLPLSLAPHAHWWTFWPPFLSFLCPPSSDTIQGPQKNPKGTFRDSTKLSRSESRDSLRKGHPSTTMIFRVAVLVYL